MQANLIYYLGCTVDAFFAMLLLVCTKGASHLDVTSFIIVNNSKPPISLPVLEMTNQPFVLIQTCGIEGVTNETLSLH